MNSNSKRKILLTGASGFFGWNFSQNIGENDQLIGLYNQHDCPWIEERHQIDLRNEREIVKLFMQIKPDAVVHAAAICDANLCQNDTNLSRGINVDSSISLAKLCVDANIPMAFTSTDLIFDGEKGSYTEDDNPAPLNEYAKQKVEAEINLRRFHENISICRLPMMFGESTAEHKTTFLDMLNKLKQQETLTLFTDEFRTMARCKKLVQAVRNSLTSPGIYNLGGYESTSRYEYGLEICKAFHFKESLIKPIKQSDLIMSAPRPKDVSMSNDKAKKELNYDPLPLSAELVEIRAALKQMGLEI